MQIGDSGAYTGSNNLCGRLVIHVGGQDGLFAAFGRPFSSVATLHRLTWNQNQISRVISRDSTKHVPLRAKILISLLIFTHFSFVVAFLLSSSFSSIQKNYNSKMTDEMAEARAKMIAKRFGGASTTTGGKGTVRRKKKAVSRSGSAQSDAKLSTTLKKLGATNIPGIEEVNLFKEDGKVIHFVNPKVQASIAANTYIISGVSETKPLQELLPSIVSQLGMDNLSQLQSMAQAAGAGAGGVEAAATAGGDDDDDVPDLVEGNFEEVSEK